MTASRAQAERCRDVLEALLHDSALLQGTSLTVQQDSGSWAVILLINDDAAVPEPPTVEVPLLLRMSGAFRPDMSSG